MTLSRLFISIGTYILLVTNSSFASSGFTYSGRILDSNSQPINAGSVEFFVWIQTTSLCTLYSEQHTISMSAADGTYAFEIGTGINQSFQTAPSNILNMKDVFDNSKLPSDFNNSQAGCNNVVLTETDPRLLRIQFIPPGQVTAQDLPPLRITYVPTAMLAMNATKIANYGTGDLLKVNPSVDQTTHANSALNQAQYDEFWKLLLGTSTTYLKTIPAMGGDVTGTVAANTVVKIRNIDIDAPAISGNVLTYNGTKMVWQAGTAGGITSINGQSGATQSFASGTTALSINSATNTHTLSISNATSSADGLLTSTDWTSFNSKQSSSLTAGQVWVGNAGNGAQARTLGGDIASISDTGIVALKSVGTAGTYYKVVTDAQGRVVSGDASMTATDLPTLADGKVWIGNGSNAATAYAMSGDATMSNIGVLNLKNKGSVGTYTKVITDAQGRVTGSASLNSGDITGALDHTPVNKAGDIMSGDLNLGGNKLTGLTNVPNVATNPACW